MEIPNFEQAGIRSLAVKTIRKAAADALNVVNNRRAGNHPMLYSRWDTMNRMMLGGWEFGTVNLIAGLSGHGKSYLLGMLHQDFIDVRLNPKLHGKFKILHFSFEMSSHNEILRAISHKVSLSYEDMMSVDRKISEDELKAIEQGVSGYNHDDILYVETPGTRYEILATIESVRKRFPEHKLVVTLDHTLLIKPFDEDNEILVQANAAKMMIQIAKTGALVILVGQLNDKIEQPVRRADPRLHYPTSTDLFGSKQVFHAMDNIWVIHMPEQLSIPNYGPRGYPTENLVVLHHLKKRFGNATGHIRMLNRLDVGTFIPFPKESEEQVYQLKL